MSEYTPTEHEVRLVWSEWSSYGGLTDRPDYDATRTEMRAEFDAMNALVGYLTENCCADDAGDCAPSAACSP